MGLAVDRDDSAPGGIPSKCGLGQAIGSLLGCQRC